LPVYANDAIFLFMATQTSMNISLAQTLRQWVEERVDNEGYGTVSEYFRALVREDQRRKGREQIDRQLAAAIESGDATEMTAEDWKHTRSTVRQKLARKAKARK
jgi:antitoxin ParD1/3/4